MWKTFPVHLNYTRQLNYWTQFRYLINWENRSLSSLSCRGGRVSQQNKLISTVSRFHCETETVSLFSTFISQRNFVYLSGCVTPKLWELSELSPVIIGNRYFSIDQTYRIASQTGTEQLVPAILSKNEYEHIAEETLESLTGYFDEIVEKSTLEDADISYGSGVLTIKLIPFGTYVINKQTPNKQIWLSSPTSGPKRYDYINETWIYKHDGRSLYQLLNEEIPSILKVPDIDFETNCSYGKATLK